MISKNRGGYSELLACAWLMSLGYDVFRNQSDNGPIDIVAVNRKTGETVFCDAKTVHPSALTTIRNNGYKRSPDQKRLNVQMIGVTHEGTCFWCTPEDDT
jgi:Holliday junction resolvase-like predicted endonuclease